jgi:small subunit ribosomal protein S18
MRPRRPRPRRQRFCQFCKEHYEPDYKDVRGLRFLVTERGKIVPRRLSGICAKHQRRTAVAVKRARHLALIPFVAENLK